jgi:hypothetical protein
MKSTLGKVMGVLTSGSYLAAVIASAKDANMLHALDARTGKPVDSFGNHCSIDLREGSNPLTAI